MKYLNLRSILSRRCWLTCCSWVPLTCQYGWSISLLPTDTAARDVGGCRATCYCSNTVRNTKQTAVHSSMRIRKSTILYFSSCSQRYALCLSYRRRVSLLMAHIQKNNRAVNTEIGIPPNTLAYSQVVRWYTSRAGLVHNHARAAKEHGATHSHICYDNGLTHSPGGRNGGVASSALLDPEFAATPCVIS